MKNLLILFVILLIAVTSAQSQSLKSLSGNEFILKDTEYSQNIESTQKKNSEFAKGKKKGDYITFSMGLFPAIEENSENDIIPYILTDLNISLFNPIYLNLGAGGMFTSENFYILGQVGLGFVYDIIPDKLYTFTGVGLGIMWQLPTSFIMLRLNSKLSKNLSVGLDTKLFNFTEIGNDISYNLAIGLNISHRFNY